MGSAAPASPEPVRCRDSPSPKPPPVAPGKSRRSILPRCDTMTAHSQVSTPIGPVLLRNMLYNCSYINAVTWLVPPRVELCERIYSPERFRPLHFFCLIVEVNRKQEVSPHILTDEDEEEVPTPSCPPQSPSLQVHVWQLLNVCPPADNLHQTCCEQKEK